MAAPAAAVSSAARWQPLSLWGGDVKALTFAPDDPDRAFAGTSSGQVYVSDNGGATWRNAGPFLPFPGWVVSRLEFDPNRPQRLWAALRGVWGSGQVAFSDDFGRNWVAASAGLPDEPVYTLALVPGRTGRLYAGTLSGVWGSEDDGQSWRRLTAALPELQKVTSLLVEPGRPDSVIAGTWRQAYHSEDGGRTWGGVFEGMVLDSEVFSLTPVPGRPGEIWASTCGWVYQTVDHGGRWERFKDGFEERRTTSFSALPDGRLLAGTVAGLHLSEDGGRTWRRIGDPALSIQAIAFHPARPGHVLLATEGSGVWAADASAPLAAGTFQERRGAAAAYGTAPVLAEDAGAATPRSTAAPGTAAPRRMAASRAAAPGLAAAPRTPGATLGLAGTAAIPPPPSPFTFRRSSRGMTNTRIGALALSGEELLIAVNHAGPMSGIHASHDGGRSFDGPARLPTVLDLAVHDGRAYAATESGLYRRLGRDWHAVPELGTRRIEQVLSDGRTLVARAADALFELKGEGFVERPFQHGTPRSAALLGDALWVSDGKGLYRLTAKANDTVTAPLPAGRLGSLADRLLLWGPAGAWTRRAGDDSMWVELEEKPSRVLATGDPRRPALLITGERVSLFDAETGTLELLEIPVLARDLTAALLTGGRLYLGTSGHGVLRTDLPDPAPPTPPIAEAGAGRR